MKKYFAISVLVIILSILAIICTILHRKKLSEASCICIITFLGVLIFFSIIFSMCIGFFLR